MNICLIVPAAGASTRYRSAGGTTDKLAALIGDRSVLGHALARVADGLHVSSVIVAGPHDAAERRRFLQSHAAAVQHIGATVCPGGPRDRWQSVRHAIGCVPAEATHIAVHDGARPLPPADMLDRLRIAAETHRAVVPAIAASDTLRRAGPEDGSGVRIATAELSRENVVLVQTPQLFEANLLRRAYEQPDPVSTDDAGLVARLGEPIAIVAGDLRNLKITRPEDLTLAKALAIAEPSS
ncbi:MAG: 2-C-methyl-D-erythritol 4-phosphate cytidylyltransferase [Planctomycetota bacterium]